MSNNDPRDGICQAEVLSCRAASLLVDQPPTRKAQPRRPRPQGARAGREQARVVIGRRRGACDRAEPDSPVRAEPDSPVILSLSKEGRRPTRPFDKLRANGSARSGRTGVRGRGKRECAVGANGDAGSPCTEQSVCLHRFGPGLQTQHRLAPFASQAITKSQAITQAITIDVINA